MAIDERAFDTFRSNLKQADKTNTLEALERMRDDIDNIRHGDETVGMEMNKFRVICQPPPMSPPCRIEEIPPNPAIVTASVDYINSSENSLKDELDALLPSSKDALVTSPGALASRPHLDDTRSGGKKFEEDLKRMKEQVQTLDTSTDKLTELTQGKVNNSLYDKASIISETEKIKKLSADIDKTIKQAQKDYRP